MFLDLCATLMRCTVHLKPVTFETFGAALEPAPQGFEENEKMIEPLGENCHTVRGTCSYGGFGGHDTQDKVIP